MSDATEADWPGEWPLRVYILHPNVKTYGDMVTAPERREYVDGDKVAALVEALKFYADHTLDGYDVEVTDFGLTRRDGRIIRDGGDKARAALAALDAKGGKDE